MDKFEVNFSSTEETSGLLENDDNAPPNQVEVYGKTIASCGFGTFQIILYLATGWALASDSVEVQVVSFVLPSACDLAMTSSQKGWLNAIIFVGMMVGGYSFGGVADIKGRRYALLWSMTINGLFGLASAFAPSFNCFIFFRFLSGVGVGAAMPILFSYFIEFMSKANRGPSYGFLASFWMVGNIMTAGLAWLIIPHIEIGGHIGNLEFGSWRIFVAICAFPSLSSAVIMIFLPESPKFLQKAGRYSEAAAVFARIFKINLGSKVPLPVEIKEFVENCELSSVASTNENLFVDDSTKSTFVRIINDTVNVLKTIGQATAKLFQGKLLLPTIILLIIWFTLSFGYYGLFMWFPEIFKRVENGGSSCTGAKVVLNISSNLTCIEKVAAEKNIYLESFLNGISNLPGNLITILLIQKVGRRPMMAASMVLSGVSVIFFIFVTTRTQMIAMSCLFSGLSVAGWNVLDALATENYPTNLRTTAFGLQSVVGRIAAILGNVAFGSMVDIHCTVPLLLVAVFLAIGGLSSLKLPKTDHTALD